MAAPTQRLTERAAAMLAGDVALAIRVRPSSEFTTSAGDHRYEDQRSEPWTNTPWLPAGGLPVVPIYRAIKERSKEMVSPDPDHPGRIIVFTKSGERILMGRDRFRSLQPTRTIRWLDPSAPISVDMTLLSEDLVPKLCIGDEHFVVNSIDFGVLVRAVVEGDVDEPELAQQLRHYYEQAKAFQHYDPNTLRAMIPGQSQTA